MPRIRGAPDLELADRHVQRARAIIEYYDPAYFFIENPTGDALRSLHTRAVTKGLPEPRLTTYCKYGTPYMKPTHIWTNAAPSVPLLQCTHATPCPARATLGEHENTAQEGSEKLEAARSEWREGTEWEVAAAVREEAETARVACAERKKALEEAREVAEALEHAEGELQEAVREAGVLRERVGRSQEEKREAIRAGWMCEIHTPEAANLELWEGTH
ncbi:hypothetical protein CYMTET_23311 [Cymbomonas tetramitiformis]|uniref:Uncharacterized protein n=1 Tax=Cymbomonas tetramitiformis TaxID=36881 RepID=A0AAE0L126_9CHLO|nr:hypothetical protein CYMTET_23311 [Cymbomonas tetramitiformis]